MLGALSLLGAAPARAETPPASRSSDLSGVSLSPAHPDPARPQTQSFFVPILAAGGAIEDAVLVHNTTPRTLHLAFYAVDGLTQIQSGATYSNRGAALSRAGLWVTPPAGTVTVAPRAMVSVPFAVRVPAGTSPGDHLAGIAVDDAAASAATPAGPGAVSVGLRLVIAVLIHVPGPAVFHLTVKGATLGTSPPGDRAAVLVDGSDDGRLLGHPRLDVTLDGPQGYHGTAAATLDTVLPGDPFHYPVPWPDTLAPGDYALRVVAAGEGMAPVTWTGRVHLGETLRGTADADVTVVTVAAGNTLSRVLLAAAALLLLLVAALLLWFLVLVPRRRRRPSLSPDEQRKLAERLKSL
jgi:hypothetical protein